ncbi:hypothetical protein ACOAPY_13920 [Pseudomonas sp. P3C3]
MSQLEALHKHLKTRVEREQREALLRTSKSLRWADAVRDLHASIQKWLAPMVADNLVTFTSANVKRVELSGTSEECSYFVPELTIELRKCPPIVVSPGPIFDDFGGRGFGEAVVVITDADGALGYLHSDSLQLIDWKISTEDRAQYPLNVDTFAYFLMQVVECAEEEAR